MKNITVSSLFLLSVLVAGTIAATPLAFADHPEAVLEPLAGSSAVGCEQTDEGCYNIPILTVAPGTEIIFRNTDNAAHTLTAGSTSEGPTGEFDSSLVMAGAEYAFTLDEEGTYNHFCAVHPWMTGQIIIDASAMSEDDHMEDDAMKDDSMMMDDESMMMDDESMMMDDESMMMDDESMMMDDESMMMDDESMMMDDESMMMDDESMMMDDESMMMDDESMKDDSMMTESVLLEPLAGSSTAGCEQTDEGCYNIPILTVAPGTEIIFRNTDNAAHTLTAGSTSEGPTGEFDSSLVMAGAEYAFTLDEEGTYNHFCVVHPWMTGQIIVAADTGSEPIEPPMDDATPIEPPMDDATEPGENGGCLIATAAFGSELAPQVQQLRELRDNTVLATESGTAFMSGFNQLYYVFSPTVADLERENPALRDTVRVALTPMLSSLTLLSHANIDTEAEMLGYGISVILLNVGMYVGAPAIAILLCAKMVRSKLYTSKTQNG